MANPFVHIELHTSDLKKAKDFYGKLFDWKLEDSQVPDFGTYTMIGVGEGTGGGMITADKGMPSAWIPYVDVADVSSSTQKARQLGAKAVEIQTARYSEARTEADQTREITFLKEAGACARQLGLHLHMGHGLNYTNVQDVAAIEGVEELNIGHSIVARAVLIGMERAVREMKEAMRDGWERRPR